MVCKMLLFDFRETEHWFFEKNKLENFDITFYKNSLNEKTIAQLSDTELENTTAISVYKFSKLTDKVLQCFKNLRVVTFRTNDFSHIDLKTCVERNIAVLNVETAETENEYTILNKSFKMVTEVLCGCRNNRII